MSGQAGNPGDEAFQRFLARVWRDEVTPLLKGPHARARAGAARVGGTVAGVGGRLLDSLFGLRGRPFSRAMTVLGSSVGALLPDVFEWDWLRQRASVAEREAVAECAARRAGELDHAEALGLFALSPRATRDELRSAWRGVSQRWHPDKARDEAQRREYHLRFVAYQQAYERLLAAYDSGSLPAGADGQ